MKQVNDCVERIKHAYLSRTPVAWIVTQDKEVANSIAISFAMEHFGKYRKGVGKPYPFEDIYNIDNTPLNSKTTPSVFFNWVGTEPTGNLITKESTLKEKIERFIDFHQELELDDESRAMHDTKHEYALWQTLAIIASPFPPNIGWLNKYIETIYVGALDDDDIRDIIKEFSKSREITIGKDLESQLTVNFRGFSKREILQVLWRCLTAEYFDNIEESRESILKELRSLKKQMLEGFNGLKWIATDGDAVPATGMGAIIQWLDERKDIFSDPKKKSSEGYDVPKGLLVTGIPGTGKSLMAKHTARILGLPLISMDMGDLQEGIVGRSEEHMAKALRMVDAMSPCVLWIDEIEKAFSGVESGHSDGGVMQRMFGKFLVWMQEKTSFCFVFATSNDISKLPPEFFRSERFDEKYYNFMPTAEECAEIFVANIKHHNKIAQQLNTEAIRPFHSKLCEKKFWLNVLNTICVSSDIKMTDEGVWEDGHTPQEKLFTGADISAIVKTLKFRILKKRDEKQRFGSDDFTTVDYVKEILPDVIKDFTPYGQTNLIDIAKCFLLLSKNPFHSASVVSQDDDIVIRFSDYDELGNKIKYCPDRFKDNDDEINAYNRTLYRCVTGAINKLLLSSRGPEHGSNTQIQ